MFFYAGVATIKIRNTYILGTSHVAKASKKEIEAFIQKRKPQAIALELDTSRYRALLHPNHAGQKPARFSWLAGTLRYMQKKAGKIVNAEAGLEMKSAIQQARKRNIPVYCIDQHISITLKHALQSMSLREKLRFFIDVLFLSKKKVKQAPFDMQKVPTQQQLKQVMQEFRQQYPGMYKVLVEERNEYMAKNLYNLMQKHQGKILAVVGAGHQQGIAQRVTWYLKKKR